MDAQASLSSQQASLSSHKPLQDLPWIAPFSRLSKADLPLVGGKGANLGEMTRQGWPVPGGFCVTTHAYRHFLEQADDAERQAIFSELKALDVTKTQALRDLGEKIRRWLLGMPIPACVEEAVLAAWQNEGAENFYAVRSSATAEDLPSASFAGQQDTYLNIQGKAALLQAIRSCWASLFTDRAIAYRVEQGFEHRHVALAVVIQKMVFPESAGILFTADPISQDRRLVSIDAGFGLGEALVSGKVSADLFQVEKGTKTIKTRKIAEKSMAIRPKPEGGTFEETLSSQQATAPSLRDDQILALAELGMQIEAHYGHPQDIEWCIQENRLYIVQSRPITSLYPLVSPQPHDEQCHVYFCFNHLQVMTDPIRPLGQSVLRWVFPIGRASITPGGSPYITSAGGRLYIDATPLLNHPRLRSRFPMLLRIADELTSASLSAFAQEPAFQKEAKTGSTLALSSFFRFMRPILRRTLGFLLGGRTKGIVAERTLYLDQILAEIRHTLSLHPKGAPRLKAFLEILGTLFQTRLAEFFMPLILSGVLSLRLAAFLCKIPLDDPDIIALARGYEGNVTTEMDLHVADLADVARRSPAVVSALRQEPRASVLPRLSEVEGGPAFFAAFEDFLRLYGMRGASEIDITRPRWSDDPTPLLQTIVGNLKKETSGSHRDRHKALIDEGEAALERLTLRARKMSGGFWRSRLVKHLTRIHRDLMGSREHPKFGLIRVMGLLRDLLREEADELHRKGLLASPQDLEFLSLEEILSLLEGSSASKDWKAEILRRKADHERFLKLSPPRVITHHGAIVVAEHRSDHLPKGALVGSRASAGIVEGIARVILDPSDAILHHGEILVAPFTDPGWTPLFIHASGLVMEVGGLMTHGSVVAREYGIPAVVCIPHATTRIKTGQRLRINGDLGYVEILEEAP